MIGDSPWKRISRKHMLGRLLLHHLVLWGKVFIVGKVKAVFVFTGNLSFLFVFCYVETLGSLCSLLTASYK